MKKIIIILVLFSINIFSQSLWPSIELIMQVINQENTITEINISSVSQTWDYNPNTQQFFLTNDQNILSSSVSITGTDVTNNNGWDMVTSANTGHPICGIGIYKMKANVGSAYFYIDFRECQFALGSQASIDTWFKYNRDEDKFYWNDLLRVDYWNQITNGELIRIWDIKTTVPSTSCINNYWQNCLVIIPSVNNHPLLVWGPYSGFNNQTVSYYKIEKNITGCNPTWFQLTQTSNTYFEDATENYCTAQPPAVCLGCNVSYRIKAVSNLGNISEPSNTAIAPVTGHFPYKRGENISNISKNFDNSLEQNYPNPFNPTTQINYSIKVAGLVTLKIYNLLGQEVADLVKDQKDAGNYTVLFNGANLPSGIYVYRLVADNFSSSKKFILLK